MIRNAGVAKLAEELAAFYTKSNFNSLADYVKAMQYFEPLPPIVANVSSNLA